MVKIQKIQVSNTQSSEFHYFTILSLITTLSTDVTKSLQCKVSKVIVMLDANDLSLFLFL